jgi:hypothetical protein
LTGTLVSSRISHPSCLGDWRSTWALVGQFLFLNSQYPGAILMPLTNIGLRHQDMPFLYCTHRTVKCRYQSIFLCASLSVPLTLSFFKLYSATISENGCKVYLPPRFNACCRSPRQSLGTKAVAWIS